MSGRFPKPLLGLAALALLAGCETTTPTKVTRFNLGEPIAPAAVAITPRNPADGGGLGFSTTASAVSAELNRLGFTIAAPDDASTPLVAVVALDVTTRPCPPRAPGPPSSGSPSSPAASPSCATARRSSPTLRC